MEAGCIWPSLCIQLHMHIGMQYTMYKKGSVERYIIVLARTHKSQSVVSSVMIEPCATKVGTSVCFHNKLADKDFYIVAC